MLRLLLALCFLQEIFSLYHGSLNGVIGSRRLSHSFVMKYIHRTSDIPPLESESPRKILLCVEPTPFNYISGYANRFQEMLKYLKKAGDDVRIITADCDDSHPKSFLDYPIVTQRGFNLPMYKQVTCTYDFAGGIPKLLKEFQPELIHVSTPSAIVYPATLWAALFNIPLVMSYHTDLVGYAKTYVPVPGSTQLARFLVKFFHSRADLVLCTSPQLRDEMLDIGISRVDVWQKGINTEVRGKIVYQVPSSNNSFEITCV